MINALSNFFDKMSDFYTMHSVFVLLFLSFTGICLFLKPVDYIQLGSL